MKKINIKEIDTKRIFCTLLPPVMAFTVNCMVYWGAPLFTVGRTAYNLSGNLDDLVPFLPPFIVVYFGCYIFWVINYLLISAQGDEHRYRFFTADICSRLVCLVIFVVFPTTNTRPELIGHDIWTQAVRALYQWDAPQNLFPIVSRIGGAFLNTRISKLGIRPFVKSNEIDLSIYEKQEFASYNEFFTRKIRAAERPADMRENVLISPSDGKVSVYPIEENGIFRIKHTPYTVRQLLRDDKLADRYMGGWIYVIRLTVDDYHRYCYVSDGYRSSERRIEGVLHTVNPVANDCYPIYKMNTREYCLLKTRKLGTVLTMEVGALMVGKICNYVKQPCEVHRGEEKGRFEFGGSTIIVMTEPGKVIPDQDLRTNTREHAETLVKMGEHIGAQIEQ